MKPIERVYYQLINGQMYPAEIKNNRLVATTMPLMPGVTNPQTQNKNDTVTPKFSIEEIED